MIFSDEHRKTIAWYITALLYTIILVFFTTLPQITPPDLGFTLSDKVLHFGAYLLFGLFWYKVFALGYKGGKASIYLILFVYGSLFGFLDEYHQYFVPNRRMEAGDIAADILGISVAIIIHKIIFKFQNRRKMKGL